MGVCMCPLQELLAEHTRRILAAAATVDPSRLMRPTRTVPVSYRGVEVLVKVTSVLMQIEVTLSARVKERAVKDKQLDPLTFEAELLDDNHDCLFASVTADMVTHAAAGRSVLNGYLLAHDPEGPGTIKQLMELKEPKALSNDKLAMLECAFLAGMEGQAGEKILTDRLLALFPTEAKQAEADLAYTTLAVQTMYQSNLAKFVSTQARGQLTSVSDILSAIRYKQNPSFKKGKCAPLVQACVDRMKFFVQTKRGDEIFYGIAGLTARYALVKKLVHNKDEKLKEQLTPELISDLQVYFWLVLPEWLEDIAAASAFLKAKHAGGGEEKKEDEDAAAAAPVEKKAKTSSSSGPSKAELLYSAAMASF